MKQLTLQNIAWYFTNELEVQVESVDGIEILPVTAIHRQDGYDIIQVSSTDYYCDSDENEFSIKPILFPMSDLTKPFIKDGEETTHLHQLAEICFSGYNENVQVLSGIDINGVNVRFESHGCYSNAWFCYNTKGDFSCINHSVTNQLALLSYLAKNKFDFQGLISDGLAIDANTLETNAYQ